MNISSISFCGNNQEYGYNEPIPTWVNHHFPDPQRFAQKDEFVHKQQIQQGRRKQVKRKNSKAIAIKSFAAGVAATLLINFGVALGENKAEVVKIPFNPQESSITEIAQQYDCDEDIIKEYNDIYYDTQLNEIKELKIPTEYDYLQDVIDKNVEKLFSSKLSIKERSELEAQVDALRAKQGAQRNVAKVYTDGKYVYYKIDLTDANGEPVYGGINVETFKELFDIKDGAIRRYNDLDTVWRKDTNFEEDKGYFDYSGNVLHSGEVIKVSTKDINIKDIELAGFTE